LTNVSDLQCAATLVLAAQAEPDADGGPAVGLRGRDRARELGAALSGRRVAMVYAGPSVASVQTAELVAGVLGLPVRVLPDLDRAPEAALSPVADLHRGETVVVVSEPGTIVDGLPPLVGPAATRGALSAIGPCSVVEVAVDADGWVLGSTTPHAG
jgi:broad specificity phosphatase PhoE